jgi:hypothetical protein
MSSRHSKRSQGGHSSSSRRSRQTTQVSQGLIFVTHPSTSTLTPHDRYQNTYVRLCGLHVLILTPLPHSCTPGLTPTAEHRPTHRISKHSPSEHPHRTLPHRTCSSYRLRRRRTRFPRAHDFSMDLLRDLKQPAQRASWPDEKLPFQ